MDNLLIRLKKLPGKKKMAMAKRQEYKKRDRISNYGSRRLDHQEKHNKGKKRQNKTQAENKCRLCVKVDETVRHLVCEFPNALCWHKGSIKGGTNRWAERYIGKYVEKLVLM